MAELAVVSTTPRATVRRPVVWMFSAGLFLFGGWLLGQGLWIHAKAVVAQWLLQRAWAETLEWKQPVKPWPWADTWPVGRIVIPELGVDQIILADASGQSLAFGPGRVGHETFPKTDDGLLLSGHRDTHFSYLKDLRKGSRITIQEVTKRWKSYQVFDSGIVDSQTTKLIQPKDTDVLILTTCYPFDAFIPGGPLRYVVSANATRAIR